MIEYDFPHGSAQGLVEGVLIALPLKGLINLDDEKNRLEKEMIKINSEIQQLHDKLNNENFVNKAPIEVVDGIKERLSEYQGNRASILEAMNRLI